MDLQVAQGRKSLHFDFLDLHGLQAVAERLRFAILRALTSSLASSNRRDNSIGMNLFET